MMAQDLLRIEQDGAWYVMSDLTVEPVSPPLRTRGEALDLLNAIVALDDPERTLVLQGKLPAPGCQWLIGGGAGLREVE